MNSAASPKTRVWKFDNTPGNCLADGASLVRPPLTSVGLACQVPVVSLASALGSVVGMRHTLPFRGSLDQLRPAGGFDPQLGTLFQTMRAALRASPAEAAVLLGTTPEVVAALERGDLDLLPAWPETARVVHRYGELLNIDVSSALMRLRQAFAVESTQRVIAAPAVVRKEHSAALRMAHPPAADAAAIGSVQRPALATFASPAAAPHRVVTGSLGWPPSSGRTAAVQASRGPAAPDFDEAEKSSRLSGAIRGLRSVAGRVLGRVANLRQIGIGVRWPSRRTALLVGLPAGFVMATMVALMTLPTGLRAGLGILPDGISQSMRAQMDRVNQRVTIGSDGLKWIVVSDPRSRKTDRLPVTARP